MNLLALLARITVVFGDPGSGKSTFLDTVLRKIQAWSGERFIRQETDSSCPTRVLPVGRARYHRGLYKGAPPWCGGGPELSYNDVRKLILNHRAPGSCGSSDPTMLESSEEFALAFHGKWLTRLDGGVCLMDRPEMGLHPKSQVLLGEILVRMARKHMLLVETNSEHLLLFLQMCVDEDRMPPGDVSFIHVRHGDPRRIPLDSEGRLLEDIPGGFFDERLSLV